MKTLPAALLAHYQQTGTTLCNLLKLTTRDGSVLGITTLNEAVTYNDGTGSTTYSSIIGMDSYAFEKSASVEVDNSEAMMLLADSGPFSATSIDAGALDYAEYVVLRVNWADLSMGHEVVDYGTVGIAKKVDGVSGVIELRSLQQQLKQNYGQLYSITCRARFGSGGGGTCVRVGECGFDAESLWQNHSVSSVGAESDRVFTADSEPAVNGPNGALSFAPGVVQWLTGSNAGAQSEIESIDGATITLRFGTPYAITDTDTFKTRPDCDKTWETCRDDYDNQLRFRGEPKIPIADEASQVTPSYSGARSSQGVLPEDTP